MTCRQRKEGTHFIGSNSVMVQSCRESAQTSTKYIAASAKRAEEHTALLEAILSQQVNNKENTFFFSFSFLSSAPKLLSD